MRRFTTRETEHVGPKRAIFCLKNDNLVMRPHRNTCAGHPLASMSLTHRPVGTRLFFSLPLNPTHTTAIARMRWGGKVPNMVGAKPRVLRVLPASLGVARSRPRAGGVGAPSNLQPGRSCTCAAGVPGGPRPAHGRRTPHFFGPSMLHWVTASANCRRDARGRARQRPLVHTSTCSPRRR